MLVIISIYFRNDVSYLNETNEESTVRLEKYRARLEELEDQSVKHNDLHDKMKARLKDMTFRMEQQNQAIASVKSNETLMKTTNIQLIQEIDSLKKQMSYFQAPVKLSQSKSEFMGRGMTMGPSTVHTSNKKNLSVLPVLSMLPLASARTNGPLESARSAIEESIFSIRSKIAV